MNALNSNIRTSYGGAVHLGTRAHETSRWIPLCGSGETTVFISRKPSSFKATTDPVTCKKCLKRLAEQAKIRAFLDMVDGVKEPALEPQTVKYQAAVDNIYFEQMRAATSIQNTWNFAAGTTRYDRWDYEMELKAAIAAEVFHASHLYRLHS